MLEKLVRRNVPSIIGSYRVDVVSEPGELETTKFLPAEIQFLLTRYSDYRPRIEAILKQGKAIGVRTVLRTPEHILRAVHTVAVHSQGNYIVTWLPELLRNKHHPKFLPLDHAEAQRHGADLDAAVKTILRDRLRFKRLVLIDEENRGIAPAEQQFMTELSELMYPLAIDYAVFRVIADNAHERTAIAQSIIKALLIVGPIAHLLEKFAAGIGKVFAASVDDLLGESAEIMALRGSGFSRRELLKRSRILVPVFALATWGAFSVHGLLEHGQLIWGGILFGTSAVALSLTTAIQSLFMYRANIVRLRAEGKVIVNRGWSATRLAFIQDFTNPARLGLILGAALAPVMGILGALLHVMNNGWVLAAIGSTESIVAGITVLSANRINELRFRRRLRRLTLLPPSLTP